MNRDNWPPITMDRVNEIAAAMEPDGIAPVRVDQNTLRGFVALIDVLRDTLNRSVCNEPPACQKARQAQEIGR